MSESARTPAGAARWRWADPPAPPPPPPVTGREEAWRFTPLRRLRGLHSDAPFTGSDFTVEVQGQDGVSAQSLTGAEAAAVKGLSKYLPVDHVSARTYQAAESVFFVDIAAETSTTAPV